MPHLDWSFDNVPEPGEQASQANPGPSRAAPAARRQAALRFGLLALLLALLGALAARWYLQRGWEQLRAAVEREAAYEDRYALAGSVALVQSAQAQADEAWLRVRAAEVDRGLPAPQPAAHLRPAGTPGRLASLQVVPGRPGEFLALVERDFIGPGGQAYPFRLPQRYRNPGPGLWERLPPDTAALIATSTYAGQRLTAEYPTVDEPTLGELLLALDAALVEACAPGAWDCPAEMRVPVVFEPGLAGLHAAANRAPPWRAAPPAGSAAAEGAWPAVFEVAATLPRQFDAVRRPTPTLAGLPANAAAGQALLHGLAAQSLLYLANQLAGPAGREADYFRDALAARAEVRLGFTPPLDAAWPTTRASAAALTAPDLVWAATERVAAAPGLSPQLQALALLDSLLAPAGSGAEARLLRALRRAPSLAEWLELGLGPAGIDGLNEWEARLVSGLGLHSPLGWDALQSAAFSCADGASVVAGSAGLSPILPGPAPDPPLPALAGALSPDGRYLADVRAGSRSQATELRLWDRADAALVYASAGRSFRLLGWAADGTLLYLQGVEPAATGPSTLYLMRLDPAAGRPEQAIIPPVVPFADSAPAWSPTRDALALTLQFGYAESISGAAAALVHVPAGAPASYVRVAPEARNPVISPDGRRLAYVTFSGEPAGLLELGTTLVVMDLDTGARHPLVTRQLLLGARPPTAGGAANPVLISSPTWSPDGSALIFEVMGQDYPPTLFLVRTGRDAEARGASPLILLALARTRPASTYAIAPVGFSADGEFFAYLLREHGRAPESRVVVVRPAAGAQVLYSAQAASAAWSPDGHRLALAGPAGAWVIDPDSRAQRWLSLEPCQAAAWWEDD